MNQAYIDTVRLLLAIAPHVFASGRFAMKGGTALNLFVQEMPRLSVDIDVVFVDHGPDRDAALQSVAQELAAMKTAIEASSRGTVRAMVPVNAEGDEVKLVASSDRAQVKVEVNLVFRGTVLPVAPRSLVDSAQDLFTTGMIVPVLATAELYGSKLVAAMDRQHPRDIFDVMHMVDRFGWPPSFIDCFVAYLAGHNRPVHEVLFPKAKSLEPSFTNEFSGMSREAIALDTLQHSQTDLLHELPPRLLPNHRDFLLSLVRGEAAWDLMPFKHLSALPAVRWKLFNLAKLKKSSRKRFDAQHRELAERLGAVGQGDSSYPPQA